jgi:hypothetical protein
MLVHELDVQARRKERGNDHPRAPQDCERMR